MALVDKMVAGYHTGFAKSIQNYSQILHLFEDSKEQVCCVVVVGCARCACARRTWSMYDSSSAIALTAWRFA